VFLSLITLQQMSEHARDLAAGRGPSIRFAGPGLGCGDCISPARRRNA